MNKHTNKTNKAYNLYTAELCYDWIPPVPRVAQDGSTRTCQTRTCQLAPAAASQLRLFIPQ